MRLHHHTKTLLTLCALFASLATASADDDSKLITRAGRVTKVDSRSGIFEMESFRNGVHRIFLTGQAVTIDGQAAPRDKVRIGDRITVKGNAIEKNDLVARQTVRISRQDENLALRFWPPTEPKKEKVERISGNVMKVDRNAKTFVLKITGSKETYLVSLRNPKGIGYSEKERSHFGEIQYGEWIEITGVKGKKENGENTFFSHEITLYR
ncbi:MAG: hypothetical protein RL885_06115 [Planctomycetota bacterium]